MPVGLFIMKWDDRMGTMVVAKYPEEIEVSDKTLMQIYSSHEYSGESGIISLMVGPLNIMSYYGGPDIKHYVVLLLNLDDDPDTYDAGLSNIGRTILQNLEDEAYIPLLPSLFQRVSVFPHLNDEQQLAISYQDQIKRLIIDRLREEGVVSKSELIIWLKDVYRSGFVDLDALINDLIKIDIIKESSVKGMPSELIFLINDMLMIRGPPINLVKNPEEKGLPPNLVQDYKTAVKNYFNIYRPSKEDNLKLIDVLINPQVYETLRFLRTAIGTRNMLEKLKKKGVDDLDEVLKILWDNKLIQVFQDKGGIEYYTLLSDFHVKKIFPKYIVHTVVSEYDVKSKSDKVLVEYLKVLEDAYYAHKEQLKEQRKEAKEAI